jgi:hypothetical protein
MDPMTRTLLDLALAAAVVLVAGCGDNLKGPEPGAGSGQRAVIVSGDFTPGDFGVMAALDVTTLSVRHQVVPSGAVAEDPMLRKLGDELFVVNRASGNNVTIVDANTFELVEQLATGAGSNPQDVAVVGDKLYVPTFSGPGLVVLTRGGGMATIDLASLDSDGQPNCISAIAVDTDVYVACELLDENFQARGPGKVAVIDTATDTVRATLTLASKNPFGVFERMPESMGGDLVIPTVPSFGDNSVGCVERITPGASPVALGCMLNLANADLKGYAARIDFQGDRSDGLQVMWVVASSFDTSPHGNLQAYDMTTGCLWGEPLTPDTDLIVDVVACANDFVVLADQTTAANGLRVLQGAEVTDGPRPIGLKPGSNHGLVCY